MFDQKELDIINKYDFNNILDNLNVLETFIIEFNKIKNCKVC